MSASYSHSEAFSALKGVNEKLTVNLTSYQYLTVLDDHLFNALTPMVQSTKFFDVFLSQIIGWQTLNPKRKTCDVGRHELVSLSTLFLLTQDPKQKMKLIRKMKLHRNIIFEALGRWLDILKEYPALSTMIGNTQVVTKLYDMNESALMRTGFSLHSTYSLVSYWTKQAKGFKESIIEKYTRMTLSTAQRDYVALGHPMPLDDFVQIYMMTMSKAIDKCDADRGVLTTHIQNWLLSAKNNAQAQATENSQDKNHQTVPLDDVEISVNDDDARTRNDVIDRVRVVAKLFDPLGVGRILLGIQEILSSEHRTLLRSLAIRPVLNTHLKLDATE
jgi:hypothetical protein